MVGSLMLLANRCSLDQGRDLFVFLFPKRPAVAKFRQVTDCLIKHNKKATTLRQNSSNYKKAGNRWYKTENYDFYYLKGTRPRDQGIRALQRDTKRVERCEKRVNYTQLHNTQQRNGFYCVGNIITKRLSDAMVQKKQYTKRSHDEKTGQRIIDKSI